MNSITRVCIGVAARITACAEQDVVTSGGDLFMNFVSVAGYSRYGSWGDLEYVHQDPATSPKYQAVIDAAARWGR